MRNRQQIKHKQCRTGTQNMKETQIGVSYVCTQTSFSLKHTSILHILDLAFHSLIFFIFLKILKF